MDATVTVTVSATGVVVPPPPTPVQFCTICDRNNKNRPSQITFRYTAGQGVNQNQQGDKAAGGGLTAFYPASATVAMSGQQKSVTDGQQFTILGSFDASSTVSINGQSFEFHTSCSVPLRAGDIYGPLTVVGGGNCPVTGGGQTFFFHASCSVGFDYDTVTVPKKE